MKATILTSRPIGHLCYEWAREHVPEDWEVSVAQEHENLDFGDIVISLQYERIITKFREGVRYYNFHPAILPQYAGASCLSWVIINGEKESGITLHELVREIDAGDIIDTHKFLVTDKDTAETLHHRTEEKLLQEFKKWFPILLLERPKGVKQDRSLRRVYKRKDLDSQKDLTRFVRALTFQGKENSFFTTRDGRIYALDYEKGITEIR